MIQKTGFKHIDNLVKAFEECGIYVNIDATKTKDGIIKNVLYTEPDVCADVEIFFDNETGSILKDSGSLESRISKFFALSDEMIFEAQRTCNSGIFCHKNCPFLKFRTCPINW